MFHPYEQVNASNFYLALRTLTRDLLNPATSSRKRVTVRFISNEHVSSPAPTPTLSRQRTPSEWSSSPPRTQSYSDYVLEQEPFLDLDDGEEMVDAHEHSMAEAKVNLPEMVPDLLSLSYDPIKSEPDDILNIFQTSDDAPSIMPPSRVSVTKALKPSRSPELDDVSSFPLPLAQKRSSPQRLPPSSSPRRSPSPSVETPSDKEKYHGAPPPEKIVHSRPISISSSESQALKLQPLVQSSKRAATYQRRSRVSALLTPGSSPVPKGKVLVPASDTSTNLSQSQSQGKNTHRPPVLLSGRARDASPSSMKKQGPRLEALESQTSLLKKVAEPEEGPRTIRTDPVCDALASSTLDCDDARTHASLHHISTSHEERGLSMKDNATSSELKHRSKLAHHSSATSRQSVERILQSPLPAPLFASHPVSPCPIISVPSGHPCRGNHSIAEEVTPAIPSKSILSRNQRSWDSSFVRYQPIESNGASTASEKVTGRKTADNSTADNSPSASGLRVKRAHGSHIWDEPSFKRMQAQRSTVGSDKRNKEEGEIPAHISSTKDVNTPVFRQNITLSRMSSQRSSDGLAYIDLSSVHAGTRKTRKRRRASMTPSEGTEADMGTPGASVKRVRRCKKLRISEPPTATLGESSSRIEQHPPLKESPIPANYSHTPTAVQLMVDSRPKLGGFEPFSDNSALTDPREIGWRRLTRILSKVVTRRSADAMI
jgi:hypothetical protein